LIYEIADLHYHLLILMAQSGIALDELYDELTVRRGKSGNLKPAREIAPDAHGPKS